MSAMQDWERLYFDDFDVGCERQIEALNRHKEKPAGGPGCRAGRRRAAAHATLERLDARARGRVWWRAVHRARSALDLFATPSPKPKLEAMLPEMFERARELAKCELHDIGQISLGESIPHACPYTFEQILDEEWWPVWSDPPEPAG